MLTVLLVVWRAWTCLSAMQVFTYWSPVVGIPFNLSLRSPATRLLLDVCGSRNTLWKLYNSLYNFYNSHFTSLYNSHSRFESDEQSATAVAQIDDLRASCPPSLVLRLSALSRLNESAKCASWRWQLQKRLSSNMTTPIGAVLLSAPVPLLDVLEKLIVGIWVFPLRL